MFFPNQFLVSCRAISMLLVLSMGLLFPLESFPFRAIFIGLLFSHFAMGFYYSRSNLNLIKEKKSALLIASVVLLIGLYFSLTMPYLAPYFLVVHAALSDAYLLKMRAKEDNEEWLALSRTVFYSACGSVGFIQMPELLMNVLVIIGVVSFIPVALLTKDKSTLGLFELPLIAVLIYTLQNGTPLHFHYMGFYHIATWYVFSFWMLFYKEQNPIKTATFFTKIAVISILFVVLFNNVLNYTITDQSFLKIIGFWSILHIFSSIPLSKFNPSSIRKLFYAT